MVVKGALAKPGALAAATKAVTTALAGAPPTPAPKKAAPFTVAKGTFFPPLILYASDFAKDLQASQAKHQLSPREVGDLSQQEFLDAMRRSAEDVMAGELITSTAWLGRYIELVAPRMPEVRHMESELGSHYRAWANGLVVESRNKPVGEGGFVDGRFTRVEVKAEFGKPVRVTDVWISPDGVSPGLKYCDAMDLARNRDGQHLMSGNEYKGPSSAKELGEQVARQRGRMRKQKHRPDATVTFTRPDGTRGSLKLSELVLVERGTEAKFNSRVGVKAGRTFSARPARDANGDPYFRITAEMPGARRLLNVMHDLLQQL